MSHPHVTIATPTHRNKIPKMIKREIQTLYNTRNWGLGDHIARKNVYIPEILYMNFCICTKRHGYCLNKSILWILLFKDI